MRLRVLQLSPTYFDPASVIGGGERYVHELSRRLTGFCEVTLVSFGKERIRRKVDGFTLEVYPSVAGKAGFTRENPFALRFLQHLREADILHVHQLSTIVGDFGLLAAKVWGKPAVVTDHGGGGGRLIHTRIPLMGLYETAIGQSAYAVKALAGRLDLATVRIPGGVDLERFRPQEAQPIAPRILYLGRLASHKGVHVLLEAFRRLNRSEVELCLVGQEAEPGYAAKLRSLAEGLRVSFHEDANDETVAGLLATSLVTILPSLHDEESGVVSELMGFTPLESQASGTPVVVSDVGALPEFVLQGETGMVVPQGNPEALAAAIEAVIDGGPSMRVRSRRWVERFGWEAVVKAHLGLYREIIGTSRMMKGGAC